MRCKHTLRNKFASDGIVMRQTWLWEYYTRSFTIVYVVLRCFTLCLTVFKCFVYTCVVRVFTCWARGKFPWDFCSESQQDPTRVFHNHNKLPHEFFQNHNRLPQEFVQIHKSSEPPQVGAESSVRSQRGCQDNVFSSVAVFHKIC